MSGVWVDVDLRTNTRKTCLSKRLDYVLTIGSLVKIMRDLCDHLRRKRIFKLIMIQKIMSSKYYEIVGCGLKSELLIILLIACLISGEVQSKK